MELIDNIDLIHTTPMGEERIKRNCNILEPINWCKNAILLANNVIRSGKNWYIEYQNIIITINAHCYTIITAHFKKNK